MDEGQHNKWCQEWDSLASEVAGYRNTKDFLRRIPSREFYLGGKVMAPQWPLKELKIENSTHFLCFTRDGYIVLLNFSPSFSYISRIHS